MITDETAGVLPCSKAAIEGSEGWSEGQCRIKSALSMGFSPPALIYSHSRVDIPGKSGVGRL